MKSVMISAIVGIVVISASAYGQNAPSKPNTSSATVANPRSAQGLSALRQSVANDAKKLQPQPKVSPESQPGYIKLEGGKGPGGRQKVGNGREKGSL